MEKNRFTGDMEKTQHQDYQGIQVSDIIQMCCLNMLTGVCSVTHDGFKGELYLKKGEIIHAWADDLQGEEAFYRIVDHGEADIEFKEGPHRATKTIFKSWEHLLMEGSRRRDVKQSQVVTADPWESGPPSRIYLQVKRIPQAADPDRPQIKYKKAYLPGLIKKKDSTEECIIDSISSEGAWVRSLGSFQVGEKFRLCFKLPPRHEEVNVLAQVVSFRPDTISLSVNFLNMDEHAKKLIGFYLWNS